MCFEFIISLSLFYILNHNSLCFFTDRHLTLWTRDPSIAGWPYNRNPRIPAIAGCRGGDLGGTVGDGPPKIWGGGTDAWAVLPIFWEVVLSDACGSMNRVKKRCHKGILFWNSGCVCEERVLYDIEHSQRNWKSGKRNGKSEKPGQWLKKGHRKFWP